MKTRLTLDMHHRTSTESVAQKKDFEGVVLPPLRHQDLNFCIEIEHESGTLDAVMQSVCWLPEEGVVSVRTSYINYESTEEMHEEADILRTMGWV